MNTKTVTGAGVTLPMDKYPHIEFSVTPAPVTLNTCVMCGQEIGPRAKTCGPNCRKRASRRKEAIKREVKAVQCHLNNLLRYADRWPDLLEEISKAGYQASIDARRTSLDLAYVKGSANAAKR